MDTLKNLRLSLFGKFDQAFDQAYRDIVTEVATRDATVKELEKQAELYRRAQKNDHLLICDLKQQIFVLQADLYSQDQGSRGQTSVKDKLGELQEVYDPERLINCVHDSRSDDIDSNFNQAVEQLKCSYCALYEEARTLLQTIGSLRTLVKRNQGLVAQWQSRLSHESSFMSIDGMHSRNQHFNRPTTKNPRLRDTSNADELAFLSLQTSAPNATGEPSTSNFDSPASTASIDDGVVRQQKLSSFPRLGSDPIHCQSHSKQSDIQANNVSIPNALKLELLSEQSDISTNSGNDCPPGYFSMNAASINTRFVGKGLAPQKPGFIKSENVSSPLRSTLQSCKSNLPGTQDLDNVNGFVTTPEKQPFAIFNSTASTFNITDDQQAQSRSHNRDHRVLQPRDRNRKSFHPVALDCFPKRRRLSERGTAAIPAIAEDGEHENIWPQKKHKPETPQDHNEPPPCSEFRDAGVHPRLHNLLEAPSPSKRQKISQGSSRVGATSSSYKVDPDFSKPRKGSEQAPPSNMSGKEESLEAQKRHAFHIDLSQDSEADHGRHPESSIFYRQQSLGSLDLSCFKVNTERNGGLDFAFDEVVRKRDRRKCLPGCMRSDCCGDKFRAMVRAGGLQLGDTDHKILEKYIGDQNHMLDTMSGQKRDNLLIEAKARFLANLLGKHRYTHERPHSPPGFWRTDMPSTQEVVEDREEAKKMERERIKERYEEAMRPGGFWKFADEC